MTWQAIEALGVAAAAIVAAAALVMSILLAQRQASQTVAIHRQQQLLAQRQLILPLWDHLCRVQDIDPEHPVWPKVRDTVNTLELIAILHEGAIIDQAIIRRTFSHQFLHLARRIDQCRNPPKGLKSGPEMLAENRAAHSLFLQLSEEQMSEGRLTPL